MRPQRFTVVASAAGNSFSPAIVVDNYPNPTNIGIGVTIVGAGSAMYTVQHTFADPFSVNLNIPTNAIWINNDTLASASVNDDTNYAFPPTAIRLQVFPAASAQATITIIQAGPDR